MSPLYCSLQVDHLLTTTLELFISLLKRNLSFSMHILPQMVPTFYVRVCLLACIWKFKLGRLYWSLTQSLACLGDITINCMLATTLLLWKVNCGVLCAAV